MKKESELINTNKEKRMEVFNKNSKSIFLLSIATTLSGTLFFISCFIQLGFGIIFLLGMLSWSFLVVYLTIKRLPFKIEIIDNNLHLMHNNQNLNTQIPLNNIEHYLINGGVGIKKNGTKKVVIILKESEWPSDLLSFLISATEECSRPKKIDLFFLMSIFTR